MRWLRGNRFAAIALTGYMAVDTMGMLQGQSCWGVGMYDYTVDEKMEFNVTGEYSTRDVYAQRKVHESRRQVQGLTKVSLVLSF